MHYNCRFVFHASTGNYLGIFLILVILEDRKPVPVIQSRLLPIVGRTRKVEQWTNIYIFPKIYGSMLCLKESLI